MKSLITNLLSLFCASLLFACTSPVTSKWELVWSDEFEGHGLPDPQKWSYEIGLVRNEEEQYYTQSNARVENGFLTIQARKELIHNPAYEANTSHWRSAREYARYSSASLITKDRMEWMYGRLEVRAKLPAGQGVWPAIWTMGTNRPQVGWPQCGEIDIMEYLGRKPGGIYATAIYGTADAPHKHRARHMADRLTEDFHTYAIEWYPDRIDFFFNHTPIHSFPIAQAGDSDNPFRKPHYLLINLALGGNWGGAIDPQTHEWHYLIDYVRLYQQALRQ